MQRDSKQRLLRYSGIVADCRVAFTVLKILQYNGMPRRMVVNEAGGALSTPTRADLLIPAVSACSSAKITRTSACSSTNANSKWSGAFRRGPDSDFCG
jgi:hypothetical protein